MRLIDADALKEQFTKAGKDYNHECVIEMLSALATIDNAPTVEPEKTQGEWIDYDNTFYKCPECGYLLEKCCPQCQNKVILPKGGAE